MCYMTFVITRKRKPTEITLKSRNIFIKQERSLYTYTLTIAFYFYSFQSIKKKGLIYD